MNYTDKKINIEDIISTFFETSIYDIKNEVETPNLNFKFNNFEEIVNYIQKYDLDFFINHLNDPCLTINIRNSTDFFNYLMQIINEQIKLFGEYSESVDIESTTKYLLRRIWLRLGINDIENIDIFLNKQLQFLKDRTFDTIEPIKISMFHNYDVLMNTKANDMWDETTRSMIFNIKDENEEYELPSILYDIDDSKTCYIYGVQSSKKEKSKRIERNLYILNNGIDNPNVHPSKVYSLLLFIDLIKNKNITKIEVPSIQVLSYHYHELLSKEAKKNLESIISLYEQNKDDLFIKNRVEYLKDWYNHVYKKENKISYLKTEELMYLMYRLLEHKSNIEITNEVNIEGDSLSLKLKKHN